MADGGHLGFDHSKIIARLIDKHLVDISCPGSSWPSENPPNIFANGTSGLILHYTPKATGYKLTGYKLKTIFCYYKVECIFAQIMLLTTCTLYTKGRTI